MINAFAKIRSPEQINTIYLTNNLFLCQEGIVWFAFDKNTEKELPPTTGVKYVITLVVKCDAVFGINVIKPCLFV